MRVKFWVREDIHDLRDLHTIVVIPSITPHGLLMEKAKQFSLTHSTTARYGYIILKDEE